MAKTKTREIRVDVPIPLHRHLAAQAKAEGSSISSLVRRAIVAEMVRAQKEVAHYAQMTGRAKRHSVDEVEQ